MNKEDLVAKIAEDAGISKRQADDALNSFIGSVIATVKNGESVTLVGFGTYKAQERAAREGRNPQTGAKIQIKKARVPKFVAGKKFKEAVDS